MGRHDSRDPRSFYTSLGGAILRGLLALFVSFGFYAVLQTFRDGRQPSEPTVAMNTNEQAPPTPTIVASEVPSPAENVSVPVDPSQDVEPEQPEPPQETVQVLDAGAGSRRTDEAIERLELLGYEIVAVNKATRTFGATTVFYSSGYQSAALSLQERDERFAQIEPNRSLSDEVDLHVVVGTDWR
ncbi:MAG: LytR C-terminal domain-containing protein [Egibacteraceae bacterium]